MRLLQRPTLPSACEQALLSLTQQVAAAPDPKAEAARLWKNKSAQHFDPIRDQLEKMATGRARCMYCEDSLGTDFEHFWPKGQYPHKTFEWLNYLLACSHCNSNLKRTQFPMDASGAPLLIDPSAEDPALHLLFTPSNGEFVASSVQGTTSIKVFGLNDNASPRRLPFARRGAYLKILALLERYDRQAASGDRAGANETKEVILHEPFSAVFVWFQACARSQNASLLLPRHIYAIAQRYQLESW